MVKQVEVVPITIRVMLFPMLRDRISTPRTRIHKVVIPSIPATTCRILQLQRVVLNGTKEDNISRVRLLLVVPGLRDKWVSPVRGVELKVAVFKRAEVVADDSRARGVFTIFPCRMLRTTRT